MKFSSGPTALEFTPSVGYAVLSPGFELVHKFPKGVMVVGIIAFKRWVIVATTTGIYRFPHGDKPLAPVKPIKKPRRRR